MKDHPSFLVPFVFFLLLACAAVGARAQSGVLFTVDSAEDFSDARVGDGLCADQAGRCTLRAALDEANATAAQDVINFALPAASVINLSAGGLTVYANVYIAGPGARNLTVQRSPAAAEDFRIFRVAADAGARITIRGLTIRRGAVSGFGGAISVESGCVVELAELRVTGSAGTRGGAIYNAGTVNLKRSLVDANAAAPNPTFTGAGGGLYAETGSVTNVTNTTLTGNSAVEGGAVYNGGRLLLINSTLAFNSAGAAAGSVFNAPDGQAGVFNTIIGKDLPAGVGSLAGQFVSHGNNLITDARGGTGFVDGVLGDQVSSGNAIDPLLAALADNGGQTDTLAPLAGSPAVDRGNSCISTRTCAAPLQNLRFLIEQRGLFRQAGPAVDVGAAEFQSAAVGGTGRLGITAFPRLSGALLVLTRLATDEKQYRTVRPDGGGAFSGLVGREPYIIEVRSKRADLRALLIFDPESLGSTPQTAPAAAENRAPTLFYDDGRSN